MGVVAVTLMEFLVLYFARAQEHKYILSIFFPNFRSFFKKIHFQIHLMVCCIELLKEEQVTWFENCLKIFIQGLLMQKIHDSIWNIEGSRHVGG